MRLTVKLDDDIYALAKAVSKAEDCSLGEAVNRLLRRAVQAVTPAKRRGRFATSPCDRRFTSEDVRAIEEQYG